MRDDELFKARIREALRLAKDNGFTQAGIAEEAGVSPQAVGQWPRSGKVSNANLAVLARLAGRPMDWFYEQSSDSEWEHDPTDPLSPAAFHTRFKQALEFADFTGTGVAARLAEMIGVSPGAVRNWLNGKGVPSPENERSVAYALGVRVNWLAFGEEPMASSEAEADQNKEILAEILKNRIEAPSQLICSPRKSTKGASRRSSNRIFMEESGIDETDGPLRLNEVVLPVYREVGLQGSSSRTKVIESQGKSIPFSLAKLDRAGVKPENAACVTMVGNSMETTIMDGSPIAIDRGCTTIIDGKIYAIDHGGMLRVKRLYRLPLGRIRIASDNDAEHPDEIVSPPDLAELRIIGRVFWWESFD